MITIAGTGELTGGGDQTGRQQKTQAAGIVRDWRCLGSTKEKRLGHVAPGVRFDVLSWQAAQPQNQG